MGRRSRQRASAPPTHEAARTAPAPAAPPAAEPRPGAEAPLTTAARRSRGDRRDAAPKPPWGTFPLVELCALAAIALFVWGILKGGHGGATLIMGAMLLGSVAGLEVAIREHFGGYRSHTLVLSGVLAFALLAVLYVTGASRTALIAGAAAGLLLGVSLFRQLFKKRTRRRRHQGAISNTSEARAQGGSHERRSGGWR